jgi:hypothetical protein
LMGFEKNFKIPKDVVDVMAQTKWPMENTIHLDTIIKRFKDMTRAPREKKKIWKRRFGFQAFPNFKDFNHYLVVKDVEHKTSVSILVEANYKLIWHIQD